MSAGRIVAIVPAFNEEGAIGGVVDAIRAVSPAFDVVVVDDGSLDRTSAIARAHGAAVVIDKFAIVEWNLYEREPDGVDWCRPFFAHLRGQGNGFGQWPFRICRSVPQTPQAPTLISAALFGIFGHGTLRITGCAPGPS